MCPYSLIFTWKLVNIQELFRLGWGYTNSEVMVAVCLYRDVLYWPQPGQPQWCSPSLLQLLWHTRTDLPSPPRRPGRQQHHQYPTHLTSHTSLFIPQWGCSCNTKYSRWLQNNEILSGLVENKSIYDRNPIDLFAFELNANIKDCEQTHF